MNKLVACCMEGHVVVWDLRTHHAVHGFASADYLVQPSATLFAVAHLPQNRDVWMVAAGDGQLQLLRYGYPDKRSVLDPEDGSARGVAGTVQQVAGAVVAQQPVTAVDWSPDRCGLFACVALDQCVRVGLVPEAHVL